MLDRGWDDIAFAARIGAGVTTRLAALDADPDIDAILVATHVPIFAEQLVRRPHESRLISAYFANLTLGKRVRVCPAPSPKSVSTSWVRIFANRGGDQMRTSTFTEEQIAYALREAESGTPVLEVCRKLGVSEQTF
jgi:Transposase